jgi:hypothetical protein
MSFRFRDIDYYDTLPPWLRKMIRDSEFPISSIVVGEKLKRLNIEDEIYKVQAAESIISGEENAMREAIRWKDEMEARRK